MMAAAIRRFHIEVERKFHPAAFSRSSPYLISPGLPNFQRLDYGGTQRFKDVYFDHASSSLIKKGIYIRLRDGQWEAKYGNSGNHLVSQFEETVSSEKITDLVKMAVSGKSEVSEIENFGLTPIADFTTKRLSLIADDRFTIALDDVDFGHMVGEIELVADLELRNNESRIAEIVNKENKKTAMGEEIQIFTDRYRWAFPTTTPDGKPVEGKLRRYLELQHNQNGAGRS